MTAKPYMQLSLSVILYQPEIQKLKSYLGFVLMLDSAMRWILYPINNPCRLFLQAKSASLGPSIH